MFSVELCGRVCPACHAEGLSQREAARRFGIHRNTVRKMLAVAMPPGCRRAKPPLRPKRGAFTAALDQILGADRAAPPKQRHTAKRIFERRRAEHGCAGGCTIVTAYVREHRAQAQEMFAPLVHPPGHAQADFGEAVAVIGGVRQKIRFFCLDLPHSDAGFPKTCPAERIEAFLDRHNAAFAFLGGVPQSILHDNTRLALARILGDGTRQRTRAFAELRSHDLFLDRFGRPGKGRFGRPGKGNDKGKAEGLVGYARRNFLVPVPVVPGFAALNAHLEQRCLERLDHRVRGHEESIGERLVRDLSALQPRPPPACEAGERKPARVSALSLVRCERNDCSVPTAYGHRPVLAKGYVGEVVIACGAAIIARHPRSHGREEFVFDPLHYPALLEQKIGALDQAAPLRGWELPESFATLRRLLEVRMGKAGKREYVQVLRLLESFRREDAEGARHQALRLGTIGFDALKPLVLCRIERPPPKLVLTLYPYLPRTRVATTSAKVCMGLLGGAVS